MMVAWESDVCRGVCIVRTEDEAGTPVSVKAALIDPASMAVIWANEPASEDAHQPASVEDVVPLAAALQVPAALRAVAETGVARHLQADVVSTTRGSVTLRVSVYRLPDGMLLVLAENAWQVRHRDAHGGASRRSGPRGG
jgi:hypothetical protein